MIRKVKMLNLALVAVCAFGAVSAAGASAAEFHIAGMGAAHGDGTQIAGQPTEFAIPEGGLKCPNAIFTVENFSNSSGVVQQTTGQTAIVTVKEPLTAQHPSDEETLTCTFAGLAGAIVHMNGCDFRVHTTATTALQATVLCPAGQQITVTAIVSQMLKCTIHIPTQGELQGIAANNEANDLLLTMDITNQITYQSTKGGGLGGCTSTQAGADGKFLGKVTVQGTAPAGTPSKLQIS